MWQSDVSKSDEVQRLESLFRFFPLHEGKILDFNNRFCYELETQGQITGLNLHWVGLKNFDFLQGLPNLTTLDLSNNEIGGGFVLLGVFLVTMTGLTDSKSFAVAADYVMNTILQKVRFIGWDVHKETIMSSCRRESGRGGYSRAREKSCRVPDSLIPRGRRRLCFRE